MPGTGLPHYSFIILQPFQTNSDTIWVIINCSQRSAPAQSSSACSSLAHETLRINSIAKFISVNYAILEGEEEGKQFPETSGGSLLTLPPQRPLGEGTLRSPCIFPRSGLWFQFCIPKANTAACQMSPLPWEEAQHMLHAKPFRWWCLTAVGVSVGSPEQFALPACKAPHHKHHLPAWHHGPTQTCAEIQPETPDPSSKVTEAVSIGWKRQPGTRCRIFSFQNPQPGWRACSGDRARLGHLLPLQLNDTATQPSLSSTAGVTQVGHQKGSVTISFGSCPITGPQCLCKCQCLLHHCYKLHSSSNGQTHSGKEATGQRQF